MDEQEYYEAELRYAEECLDYVLRCFGPVQVIRMALNFLDKSEDEGQVPF